MPEDTTEVPEASAEPEATAAQGAQAAAEVEVTIVPSADWKAQESFSEALKNVHDGRRMAAGAVFSVMASGVKMLEDQLTSARSDRQAADQRERDTLDRYYKQRENAAVSNAKLEAAGESSRLRSVMQNLGSVLLGVAITLYITPCPTPAADAHQLGLGTTYLVGIFGAVGILLFALSLRLPRIFRR